MKKVAFCILMILITTVFAQDGVIDQTTGNLVYTTSTNGYTNPPPNGDWTGYNWSGFVGTTSTGGGYSGGYAPGWNSTIGTFMFGYNQGTISYSAGVSSALAAAGSGVMVNGYTYSWQYINQDMTRGTLTGNINLTDASGATLESYNYNMPTTQNGWTTMSGTQNFNASYASSILGHLNVSFSGHDDRWWAGYYGPQIRDIDVRLKFGVDPCATNPAYSPNCAGFSSIVTSTNLVPNPEAYAVYGSSVNNTYAINQALSNGGSGITIHGFNWGYTANTLGPYCAFGDASGCYDFRNPKALVHVGITDNAGNMLYSMDKTYMNSFNTVNFTYLFPVSRNLTTLGNFEFSARTEDAAYVGQMYSTAIYTPDPCATNPLYSPTCKGYADAMTKYLASLQPTTNTTTTTTTVDTVTAPAVVAAPTSASTSTTTSTTTGMTDTSSATSSNLIGSVTASPTIVSAPAPTTVSSSTSTSTSTASSSSSSSKDSSGGSSSGTSIGLSVIAKNQDRENAISASAVQNAISTAGAAAQQAQQEAATVAAQAVANSVTAGQAALKSDGPSNGARTGGTSLGAIDVVSQGNQMNSLASFMSPMTTTSNSQKQEQASIAITNPQSSQTNTNAQTMQPVLTVAMVPVNTSTSNLASTLTVQAPVQPKAQAPIQSTQIQKASQQTFNAQEQPVAISVPTYTLMPPQQPIVLQSYIVPTVMTDNTQATQVAINNQQLSSNGVEVPILLSNFLTDKSNPINDIVDNKMGIPQPAQTVQQGPSVNKNAGNNEVAGGVDINKMALLPTGYGDYLNMVMKDSAFYEPKEVYKNQKTVDNVKALRQLSSDRLHQQMVEQQYAR